MEINDPYEQQDAIRFRWLCEHPDWQFIEQLCRTFAANSKDEFINELRFAIDVRRSRETRNGV